MVQSIDAACTEIDITDEDVRKARELFKEKQVLRFLQHLMNFSCPEGKKSLPS